MQRAGVLSGRGNDRVGLLLGLCGYTSRGEDGFDLGLICHILDPSKDVYVRSCSYCVCFSEHLELVGGFDHARGVHGSHQLGGLEYGGVG